MMTAKKPTVETQVDAPLVGVFEALEPLFVAGVRAHSPGDRVRPEHVEAYGWQSKVRRVDG
jgi:hypothetical protein